MKGKVIDLEEIRNILIAKKRIDNKEIEIEELSLEELEGVKELYRGEIESLKTAIELKEKENYYLRRLIKEIKDEW